MILLHATRCTRGMRREITQLRARIEDHVANASNNNSTPSANYLEHLHSELFKNIPINMDDASVALLNLLSVFNSHLGDENLMSFTSLRG